MKIDRITLENFGIYNRKVLQFDAAPLVLIYGPNESGKTTALNGLRQALFGFKTRTPYLTGRQMSADVCGQLADGQTLEFSRRKGRQDDLTGTLSGRSLKAAEIQQLLCNLDLSSYEHLFGFSLVELRRGEEALKSTRLSEALAGGGLGGMSALQQLRSELNDSLTELYKSRGSTSAINLKLTDIKQSHDALRASQILPSQVDDLQRQLLEMKQSSEQIRQEHTRAVQARMVAERSREALPKFRQRAALQRRLQEIDLPAGIDMTFVNQWGDYADQRKALVARLQTERNLLEQERQKLQQLGGSQEISAAEQEIELVGHQAGEVATLRLRLGDLHEQIDDAQSICNRLLETLELEQVDERLRQFSISAPRRRELEGLSQEYAAATQDIIASTAQLEAAKETLTAIEHAPELEPQPGNMAELSDLVNKLQETERGMTNKAQALQAAADDRGIHALEQRLTTELGGRIALDVSWQLPTLEQVQQQQRAEDELQRELAHTHRQATKIEKELKQARRMLQELDRREADALLAEIARVQAERDQIHSQWLDDLSQPLIAASISPGEQSQRLIALQRLAVEADELQAGVLSAAAAVAAFHQQTQQINALESDLAATQQTLRTLADRQTGLQAAWLELWQALPFQPATAERMSAWLTEFLAWRESALSLAKLRRETHIARGIARQQRSLLLDLWPTNLREDTACEVLVAQLRQWESAARDWQRDQQRLRASVASVQTLTERLQALQRRQRELVATYSTWLQQVPIAIDWPLEQVGKLVDTIEHVRRESETAARCTAQAGAIQHQLDQYDQRVRELAKTLQHDITAGPLEAHAERWLAALQAMRSERTQRIELTVSIEHRSQHVTDMLARQQELDSKLAALCSTSGSSDAAGMNSLVERARQADQLRSQIAELTAAIEPHCGTEPLEAFLARLATADEAVQEIEIQELTRESLRLDEARQETDQAIGGLTQRIEQLANSQAAQRNLQLLQDNRGQLADLAEQWVIQRLAQELLTRSIERFAADHEPALLQYTRRYLSKLTGGRYRSVEHDSSKPGTFVVRNAREEAFTPEQLSTGTREQLYLAIRMAFITHHCEHHEPLPVVMDDCFVNFDDARTRLALEAIAAWDHSIQTILLSCHWRVVQSLAEFAPATTVIHLEKELLTTAGELVASNQLLAP